MDDTQYIYDNIMCKKRPRSVNWETAEKDALLLGVKAHVNVLEDKKKLASCNKQKEECWRDIQYKLATLGYHRDLSRIREQWQRMKASAKKSILSYRRSLQGGGRKAAVEPTETDYFIAEIIPQEFVDDASQTECDSGTAPVLPETEIAIKREVIDIKQFKESFRPEDVKEHDDYIAAQPFEYPEVVLSPLPVKLKREKQRPMSEYEQRMLQLNERKLGKAMAESEELHRLRVKHDVELHAVRLNAERELLRLKIAHAEMKIKHEEEIHREKLKKIKRDV